MKLDYSDFVVLNILLFGRAKDNGYGLERFFLPRDKDLQDSLIHG